MRGNLKHRFSDKGPCQEEKLPEIPENQRFVNRLELGKIFIALKPPQPTLLGNVKDLPRKDQIVVLEGLRKLILGIDQDI